MTAHLVSVHAAALSLGVLRHTVGEGAARAWGAGVHLACGWETGNSNVSYDHGSLQDTYYMLKSILFVIGLKVLLPLGLRCTISSHTPLSLASRDFMNTPHFLLTLPLSMAWPMIKLWTLDTNTHTSLTLHCPLHRILPFSRDKELVTSYVAPHGVL